MSHKLPIGYNICSLLFFMTRLYHLYLATWLQHLHLAVWLLCEFKYFFSLDYSMYELLIQSFFLCFTFNL